MELIVRPSRLGLLTVPTYRRHARRQKSSMTAEMGHCLRSRPGLSFWPPLTTYLDTNHRDGWWVPYAVHGLGFRRCRCPSVPSFIALNYKYPAQVRGAKAESILRALRRGS